MSVTNEMTLRWPVVGNPMGPPGQTRTFLYRPYNYYENHGFSLFLSLSTTYLFLFLKTYPPQTSYSHFNNVPTTVCKHFLKTYPTQTSCSSVVRISVCVKMMGLWNIDNWGAKKYTIIFVVKYYPLKKLWYLYGNSCRSKSLCILGKRPSNRNVLTPQIGLKWAVCGENVLVFGGKVSRRAALFG